MKQLPYYALYPPSRCHCHIPTKAIFVYLLRQLHLLIVICSSSCMGEGVWVMRIRDIEMNI